MVRPSRGERSWDATAVAPRQERASEVTRPRHDTISVRLTKPNAQLGALAPGEHITVRTRNSQYRLIVLDQTGRNILIKGGRYFLRSTEACLLEGSTVLQLLSGGPGVGRGLQFVVGDTCFITSRILKIEREGTSARAHTE